MILLSACAASSGTSPDAACLIFEPLTWSSRDTDDTKRGIFTHNTKWLDLCQPGEEPAE
jgi:hypothetical protein